MRHIPIALVVYLCLPTIAAGQSPDLLERVWSAAGPATERVMFTEASMIGVDGVSVDCETVRVRELASARVLARGLRITATAPGPIIRRSMVLVDASLLQTMADGLGSMIAAAAAPKPTAAYAGAGKTDLRGQRELALTVTPLLRFVLHLSDEVGVVVVIGEDPPITTAVHPKKLADLAACAAAGIAIDRQR